MSNVGLPATLLLLASLAGCTIGEPYRFGLRNNSEWPIEGKIIGSYKNVNVYADNALTLMPGAAVGMRTRQHTDAKVSMQLTMQDDTELTLLARITAFDDTVRHADAMELTITTRSTPMATFRPFGGPARTMPLTIVPNKPFIVEITHDGHWTNVTVGCTHLGRFATNKPAAEWLVLRAAGASPVDVVDPIFTPLYEE